MRSPIACWSIVTKLCLQNILCCIFVKMPSNWPCNFVEFLYPNLMRQFCCTSTVFCYSYDGSSVKHSLVSAFVLVQYLRQNPPQKILCLHAAYTGYYFSFHTSRMAWDFCAGISGMVTNSPLRPGLIATNGELGVSRVYFVFWRTENTKMTRWFPGSAGQDVGCYSVQIRWYF